jgi:putative flippase GtrA
MIGDKTAPDLPMLRDDEPATLPQLDGLRALLRLTEPVTYPPRLPAAVSPVSRRGSHRAQVPAQTHWRRLGTFGLIGAVVFLAGVGLQVGLVRLAGMSHLASYAIQTAVSIQLSYLLNRLITWRDRDVAPSSWLRFGFQQAIVQGLGVAGYAGLTRIGVEYVAANIAVTAVLAPAGYASSHLWSMTDRRGRFARIASRMPWPLLGVLAVQAGLSLRLVWSNTAYTDEALYIWAGHMEWDHWLHGTNIAQFGFPGYFSGAPVIYPPMAALLDSIGGLTAARLLSLVFMMGATILLWSATRRLYGRRAALAACGLFVAAGGQQDLSAFATYDAMAVLCLAVAFWLGIRASRSLSAARWGLYVGCALILALANAAKYASGLWDPIVIAAAATATWQARGRVRSGVVPAVVMTAMLGSVLAAALKLAGPEYRRGIEITTTARSTGAFDYSIGAVLWLGFTLTWVVLLLAFASVIYARRGDPSERLFRLACALAVAAPILNEARIHTIASLYKHVAFGVWFAAVVAGALIAQASRVPVRKAWQVCAAPLAVAIVAGYGQGTMYFHYWANLGPVVKALSVPVASDPGRLAAGDQDPLTYYLSSRLPASQISALPTTQQLADHYYRYIEMATQQPLNGQWSDREGELEEATALRRVAQFSQAPGYRQLGSYAERDQWYVVTFHIWEYEGVRR